MVERGGRVVLRHVERVTAESLRSVLDSMVAVDVRLMTDTGRVAKHLGNGRQHHLVNHSADEYVRYEEGICITTNPIESYFTIVKRGINGVFHHIGHNHLHRYLAEFDFRYNERKVTDGERAESALKGFDDKRLMYEDGGSSVTSLVSELPSWL